MSKLDKFMSKLTMLFDEIISNFFTNGYFKNLEKEDPLFKPTLQIQLSSALKSGLPSRDLTLTLELIFLKMLAYTLKL